MNTNVLHLREARRKRAAETYVPENVGIVAIGGVFTTKPCFPLYYPLLSLDKSSDINAFERFIPPPGLGIGPVDTTRRKTGEALERISDRLGKRLLVVGHSLGGLLSMAATLDKPDIVAGVVSLGGAHDGIRDFTPEVKGLILAAGRPAHASAIHHQSSFMQEHREQVTEEWPEGVPFHVVSTALDRFIIPPHGFGMTPRGELSQNTLYVPPKGLRLPFVNRMIAAAGEGAELHTSLLIPEHVTLPAHPDVIRQVNDVWQQVSMPATPTNIVASAV